MKATTCAFGSLFAPSFPTNQLIIIFSPILHAAGSGRRRRSIDSSSNGRWWKKMVSSPPLPSMCPPFPVRKSNRVQSADPSQFQKPFSPFFLSFFSVGLDQPKVNRSTERRKGCKQKNFIFGGTKKTIIILNLLLVHIYYTK